LKEETMTEIVPTKGRIVWYVLSDDDVITINKRRDDARKHLAAHIELSNGAMVHVGNDVRAGDIAPAMVVAVRGDQPDSYVNLKVELDGSDNFWATSRKVGEGPGTYHWMPYQVGQAKKHA
jgi:hypothetical protein